MNEHSGSEHESPHLRDAALATHRDPAPAAALGLAALSHLQRQVGNRAVGRYLQQRPASVQRDPGGWKPKDSPRLKLDPQIEAQIRAITAMNALTVPEHVMGGLLELNLPPVPAGAPSTTAPPPAPAAPAAPATPTGPAPGTGLLGPREGTAGDVWKAVLSDPSMGPTIVTLGERAATRAQNEFGQLSTGATVAVVTNTVAIGGGAVVMLLANPDVRKWITATLNDKIIPVPKIPGLGVQLNLSGDNIIVGLHLDVGKILPAALGFGPASATTPLGAPPNPYDSVQRRVAADRVDGDHRAPGGPVVQRDHGPPEPAAPVIERDLRPPERAAVVQRDPIPGGAAGQTTAATGGVIGLKSIDGSFQLPAGKVLSSTGARIVKTTDTNTILIQVSSEKISLKIINGIYIDAQWPVQNMRLFNVTHTLATNETTSDVRLVDDELGDGFIDMTGTARSSIAETLGTIISRTALDRARLRPPDPSNDTRQPPAPQTAPTVPKGAFGNLVPAYDPLKDEKPEETLAALIANLTAMPSDGGSDVGASDLSKISLGATVVINKGFEKMDNGTGLRIAAGTPVSVMIDSGASVAQLKGAGKGAAALAAAADVKAVHISSPGFDVIKDGQRLATIDRLRVSRGQVDVGRQDVTLFGAAKEAAKTEQGSRLIFGGIGGLVESGGVPAAFGFGVQNTINDGADRPTLVPGIVAGVLEAKLQAAFTEFLAAQGRTIIPGVDLGSVLGVPGAPVNAK